MNYHIVTKEQDNITEKLRVSTLIDIFLLIFKKNLNN